MYHDDTYVVVEEHEALLGLGIGARDGGEIQSRSLMSSVLPTDILEQLLEDRSRPGMRGVSDDTVEQGVVSVLLLSLGHRQTRVDSIGNTEEVMRIDSKGRLERGRGPHELGKDKWGFVCFVLTQSEFHRGRVHTVAERGDQGEIGD